MESSPTFGFKHCAAHADDIAKVRDFKQFVLLFANIVLTDVNLNLPGDILDMGEPGFSFAALCHDAAGDGDFNLLFFKFLFRQIAVQFEQFLRFMSALEPFAKRVDTQFLKFFSAFPCGRAVGRSILHDSYLIHSI